jgi:hypothetical protein
MPLNKNLFWLSFGLRLSSNPPINFIMSLIFAGDVASPTAETTLQFLDSLKGSPPFSAGHATILNLEGMLAEADVNTPTPILFNHPSMAEALKQLGVRAVSLANNHALDLPNHLADTRKGLDAVSIASCGVAQDQVQAATACSFTVDGQEVRVIGACWELLTQHQKNSPGRCYVNPLKAGQLIKQVATERAEHPDAVIVLKLHWSFDLETLPFPMYRTLARALIDAGTDVVMGSHSHCVQGGERYRDGIIVYGLGNFYIPWHTFIRGTIHFPEFSRDTVTIEWDPRSKSAQCHWFRYENSEGIHRLEYKGVEDFDSGERIQTTSPYRNMKDSEYLAWFPAHRRKKQLIPVHRDHREHLRNEVIDSYLKWRLRFARLLAKTGLRGWNN